jgi:hypothetical protein
VAEAPVRGSEILKNENPAALTAPPRFCCWSSSRVLRKARLRASTIFGFNTLRKVVCFLIFSAFLRGRQESTRRNVVKPSKGVREVRISWEQAVIYQQPARVN